MQSTVTKRFRKSLSQLPLSIQKQAYQAYKIWRTSPYHSSLQFKRVSQRQKFYSVRIGIGYRALGLRDGNHIYWFWIGTHAEYDEILKHL